MARRAIVVTVSDGVAAGTRTDEGGAAVAERLADAGYEPVERQQVADEVDAVRAVLQAGAAANDLLVTTGGTGLGPRDLTPEATRPLLDREVPGVAEAMRAAGRAKTPLADLSRGLVGHVGSCLVANLPGSPKGALENLEVLLTTAAHLHDLLDGVTGHGQPDDTAPTAAGAGAAPGSTPDEPTGIPVDRAGQAQVEQDVAETDIPVDASGQALVEPDRATAATGAGSGDDVLDRLVMARAEHRDVVHAVAVATDGQPPCTVGMQAMLAPDGSAVVAGTLGCSDFDAAARADAAAVLASGEPRTATYTHEDGTVDVLLTPHAAPTLLVLLGNTAVARHAATFARDLAFEVVVVPDVDVERVDADLAAAAHTVRPLDDALLDDVRARPGVVVAHTDHDDPDLVPRLRALVEAGAAGVELMGSRRHVAEHLQALRDGGVDTSVVHTPAGLDVGGRRAAEIALSIVAALVARRNGRTGGFLADD